MGARTTGTLPSALRKSGHTSFDQVLNAATETMVHQYTVNYYKPVAYFREDARGSVESVAEAGKGSERLSVGSEISICKVQWNGVRENRCFRLSPPPASSLFHLCENETPRPQAPELSVLFSCLPIDVLQY